MMHICGPDQNEFGILSQGALLLGKLSSGFGGEEEGKKQKDPKSAFTNVKA